MTKQGQISVVCFTHLGYESDTISSVIYHTVNKLVDAELLRSLYVLDVKHNMGIDPELLCTPLPGGKTTSRMLFLLERMLPFDFDARLNSSKVFDRHVARQIGNEDILHLFPEFRTTAKSASEQEITTVVYGRGCHPAETLRRYEEEAERFSTNIDIPYTWYNRDWETCDYADYVLYLHEYSKQTYMKHGVPEDRLLRVGPLSVDPEVFSPGESSNDDFVVLAVSHMDALKGTRYLIDAWEMLSLDNAKLVLCGGMTESVSAELQPQIQDNDSIEHLGHVSEISKEYQKASVFVQPSIREGGLAKTVLEAMATEVPTIITENAGEEYVRDSGFVVPIRDSSAIAEKIQYLYDNPTAATEMGQQGRKLVLDEFSWNTFSDRVKRAYDKIASRESETS